MNLRNPFEEEERGFSAQSSDRRKGLITISLSKLQCPEMAGREEAMEAVLCQILAIAHRKMRGTRERLGLETVEWQNREHFYATCSKWMSQIVIDQWRHATAICNGGGLERIPLTDSLLFINRDPVTLLALREALDQLAKLNARKSLVAELRFLWGMTIEEVALSLDISPVSVKREWKIARMWLEDYLAPIAIPAEPLLAAA
jgi:RNA polymerase sigma factor (TIGR02999 family)